ncbi:hypothetical protein Ae201684P_004853 [Aphanomyces euteiches]|uniref:Tc1-like transposase DDE domain-containing protein n=1 Tax=Aphanomyces euteiches TaxID=100861 RepID=A0A6G0WKQ7_9STRA|nr:hypothetical protein Ae201684_014175 [Aphanomyces euteiches]KAH9069163.1 hypothetical protein Ae201684P_004853 [Aphanomyces euteiches]
MKSQGRLKKRSNSLKPYLTKDNKKTRLEFALSFVKPNQVFDRMYDVVHVDEKWLYLTKLIGKYYVYDDEQLPTRHVESKRFITKVMFLAAVARPRFDFHSHKYFDGKLGVWTFVSREPALRSSVKRPKGALITRPLSVTADAYLDMLTSKVIPAIIEKMPPSARTRTVFIQQDNAGPHSSKVNKAICEMDCSDGWNIQMPNQPPNNPDFNVLDLGFFNAIQSLQYQSTPSNIDELIDAVVYSFGALPSDTLGKTFVTLQKVLQISIDIEGSDAYKLPHMNKNGTIEDLSTFNLSCEEDSLVLALSKLNRRLEDESNLEDLMNCLDEVAI